ncbi:MAG: hypothetical protein CVT59_01075 [Actinobacteria bacterium HGW-Actinobacteria-1]|jgi:competence protein ComGC|nr:MAG: hypothetical protein CVT59_01075 [Actinobacteria bacterium HGW-Actinobacteria-1]
MARAGFCTSCGANVYLAAGDACPMGHGTECIQNVYEAPDPVVAPTVPPKKKNALLIVAIVLALCLPACALVVGIVTAISIPVFNSAQGSAEERACFANQRVIEGAAQQALAADGVLPSEISDLVDDGYILEVPTCLSGGEYVYSASDGTVECTFHGRYTDSEDTSY